MSIFAYTDRATRLAALGGLPADERARTKPYRAAGHAFSRRHPVTGRAGSELLARADRRY